MGSNTPTSSSNSPRDQSGSGGSSGRSTRPGLYPLLRFIDLFTPVVRLQVHRQGAVPNTISEICVSISYQTHRGRYQGAEPKCRAFSLRHLAPHELYFRAWIEDDFNFNLLPDDPANARRSQYNRDPIPLPPAAYTALADHIRLPSTDVTFLGKEEASSIPPRPIPSESQRLYWREGYYLWTSRSRRDIAHHLSTGMRLPPDTECIYNNQRQAWLEDLERGHDPFFDPQSSTNTFIWSVAYDFLPESLDRNWPATMLVPLKDPPPIGPELARLFAPVSAKWGRAYARASQFTARQLFLSRQIGTLWAEGKPVKIVGRLGRAWADGKVAKHAAGLGATFIRIIRRVWSPPKGGD